VIVSLRKRRQGMDRSSLFKMSGLPEPFGLVLLVFFFILLLTPYFAGQDFGPFKTLTVNERAKRLLKIIGPILFVSCILLFVPFFPDDKQTASAAPSPTPLRPTPSTEPTPPADVNGAKANADTSNTSKGGNLPVNADNAGAIKTQPSPHETANASLQCTEEPQPIFDNYDDGPYKGNPPSPATEFPILEGFSDKNPIKITNIYTRHRGWEGTTPPGASIKLLDSAGRELGSWRVTPGRTEEWVCSPNILLTTGTYRVVDSYPATWTQNAGSKYQGMILVVGCTTADKPK
jgi:hypothetical protein